MFSTSTEFWLYHIDSYCIYSIASWLNQYLHWTKVERTHRKSQRYSSCHTRCQGTSLRLGLVPEVLIKHKKRSFDQIWLGNTTTRDGFEPHFPQYISIKFQVGYFFDFQTYPNQTIIDSTNPLRCLMWKPWSTVDAAANKAQVFGLQHVEPGKIKVCSTIECNPKRDELLNGNYSALCVDVDTKRCPKVICVGFKTPLTLTI